MLVKINSATNVGLNTIPVTVEVNVANMGFPSFDIVGLPSKSIAESKERVRTALNNSGFKFPNKRITVNLAPADVPKEGSYYDLPIALGILCASSEVPVPVASAVFGELSLDGKVRGINGGILFALFCVDNSLETIYLPKESVNEALQVRRLTVFGVTTLTELVLHIRGASPLCSIATAEEPASVVAPVNTPQVPKVFLADIVGQSFGKQALEIVAAGGHNMLFRGPPGAGKSLLCRALHALLPPLTEPERLEVTKIHSLASSTANTFLGIVDKRPYRNPHHTISHVGLVGGGLNPRPGEISLAHNGVLFLDELCEFSRSCLEALREPLESGFIHIIRAGYKVYFPARFILVGATNSCPCGYAGHPDKECNCTPSQISRYTKKISGPIQDRIDLHALILPVKSTELLSFSSSVNVHMRDTVQAASVARIKMARNAQQQRFHATKSCYNAYMNHEDIAKFCRLTSACEQLLNEASEKFHISTRSLLKTIKVARTVADLAVPLCIIVPTQISGNVLMLVV